MKTLRLTFVGLALASLAPIVSAQWLVAGWDFSNTKPDGNFGNVLPATFSDSFGDVIYVVQSNPAAAAGVFYSNGAFGSSSFDYGNFLGTVRTNNPAHSTLNTTIATERRSTPGDPLFNSHLNSRGGLAQGLVINPTAERNRVAFVVDTRFATGDLSISFAGGHAGSGTPASTVSWFYQIGEDGPVQPLGVNTLVSGTTFAVYSASFAGVALTGFERLSLIAQIATSPATNMNPLRMDNVQILAAGGVIPEPSTYAALLGLATLGFVMLRRRRKSSDR